VVGNVTEKINLSCFKLNKYGLFKSKHKVLARIKIVIERDY